MACNMPGAVSLTVGFMPHTVSPPVVNGLRTKRSPHGRCGARRRVSERKAVLLVGRTQAGRAHGKTAGWIVFSVDRPLLGGWRLSNAPASAVRMVARAEPVRQRRRAETPSQHVARITWILLTLLYDGVLQYASCVDRFGISRREFQRDLAKLREVGASQGFTISKTTGGRVFLRASGSRIERLSAQGRDAAATLSRIAAALGGPAEREIRAAIGDVAVDPRAGFLHVREPLPSDGARIAGVYAFLKDAAAGPARVEFMYTPARGGRMQRRVEPYHVVARSGRYYLIGYDLVRRDWRYFALDAISGPMRKEGTFASRSVPGRFLAEQAVGWISGSKTIDVTVRVTPVVAAAVTARAWQHGQRVEPRPDGSAEITLTLDDVDEAVRLGLGFGAEALVVGPPEAVAVARLTVDRLARAYAGEVSPRRKLRTG